MHQAAATTPSSASTTGSFGFGQPSASTATSTNAAGFSFGNLSTEKPVASGFAFGLPAPSTSIGAAGAVTTKPQNAGLPLPTGTANPGGFSLASGQNTTTAVQAPGLTLGSSLSAAAVTNPSKPGNTAIASQLSGLLSFPATGAATTTVSNALASSSAGGVAPVTTTAVAAGAAGAAASTSTIGSSSSGPKMSYKELEDQMNKWWVELEHQEKAFLEQATKVNAWDKVLINNGQKITNLNADVDKVKLDQHRLNNELDFIVAQQKELEEMLVPLEDSVSKLPAINYQQHTDSEREHTYQIAEHIDAQLKRMTEDLKEVIDHLNTSTGSHDQTHPMQQISKILNAHMESLQWVDQNAAVLQRKTEEVARYADYTKKEHERSFRLAYS